MIKIGYLSSSGVKKNLSGGWGQPLLTSMARTLVRLILLGENTLILISVYVIVIARGQGFMAVNEPSPRAKPEDKVCLHCHKSLLYLLYIPSDWS